MALYTSKNSDVQIHPRKNGNCQPEANGCFPVASKVPYIRNHNKWIQIPCAPWCWNIYQHLPEQHHPVM